MNPMARTWTKLNLDQSQYDSLVSFQETFKFDCFVLVKGYSNSSIASRPSLYFHLELSDTSEESVLLDQYLWLELRDRYLSLIHI